MNFEIETEFLGILLAPSFKLNFELSPQKMWGLRVTEVTVTRKSLNLEEAESYMKQQQEVLAAVRQAKEYLENRLNTQAPHDAVIGQKCRSWVGCSMTSE
jgi:hypothetical protein